MRVELRPKGSASTGGDSRDHLLLVAESQTESAVLDLVFGERIDDVWHAMQARPRLADGYGEHYIEVRRS